MITVLPSQAVAGNSYGTIPHREWRKVSRKYRAAKAQENEREALRVEAMQEAFGPTWPYLPPGATDDPSIL